MLVQCRLADVIDIYMSDDIAHDFIYPHKPLCLIKTDQQVLWESLGPKGKERERERGRERERERERK
ncbi:hypothetical protein L345_09131, partial [Ophiophagus hannah]